MVNKPHNSLLVAKQHDAYCFVMVLCVHESSDRSGLSAVLEVEGPTLVAAAYAAMLLLISLRRLLRPSGTACLKPL